MNIFNCQYDQNFHEDYGIDGEEVFQIIIRTLPSNDNQLKSINNFNGFGNYTEMTMGGDGVLDSVLSSLLNFSKGIGYDFPTNAQIIQIKEEDKELEEELSDALIIEPDFSGNKTPELIEFIGTTKLSTLFEGCPSNNRCVKRLYNPKCYDDILLFFRQSLNCYGFFCGKLILVDYGVILNKQYGTKNEKELLTKLEENFPEWYHSSNNFFHSNF